MGGRVTGAVRVLLTERREGRGLKWRRGERPEWRVRILWLRGKEKEADLVQECKMYWQ